MQTLRTLLDGPAPQLPRVLDALAERWWRATARRRLLVVVVAMLTVPVALVGLRPADPAGPPIEVLVATRDLGPGEQLDADLLDVRAVPATLVPPDASTRTTGRLGARLPAGAVLTDGHLSEAGLAAGLEHGQLAVPVPRDLLPALAPGTRVDLVATAIDGATGVAARDAVVLGDDGTYLWLAVARDAAEAVAGTVSGGHLGVLVRP